MEPLIHSHLTDVLPEGHPLAFDEVYCSDCGVMVHCGNNECMQTWIETGRGNFCTKCFFKYEVDVLEGNWGLKLKMTRERRNPERAKKLIPSRFMCHCLLVKGVQLSRCWERQNTYSPNGRRGSELDFIPVFVYL